MPYELGRALLLSEAVTPAALSRALFVVATEGVPLPRVLVALGFISAEKLDEELARTEAPTVQNVVPVRDLVDALPAGLCSRLLAIPIRMDARTGTVDVAVADARDPHGAHEIGFFLKAPVRVVRAKLAVLERALDRSATPPGAHALATPVWVTQRKIKETPAWGTPVPRPGPRASGIRSFGMLDEPIESDLPPVLRAMPPPAPSRRSLSSPPVGHALLTQEEAVVIWQRRLPYPPPDDLTLPSLPFPDPSKALSGMRAALDRDEVLHVLLTATRAVARKVALFAVKKDAFVGWRCTPEFGDETELRKIRVGVTLPSALATAATAGHYLGPIHKSEAHTPLLYVMGKATRDIAITVVRVQGIPTILVIADELGDTALGTQRIDELARAAGEALTRILKRAR